MCKVICPMDEYGESRTFESFYGKNDKKWPVHMSGVSVCGKLEGPNSIVLAYYEGNVV